MWFLRDVLGCSPSKEKGSDDAADDAVPSCVPTKKIVVIVNKRSGSQMVRPRQPRRARVVRRALIHPSSFRLPERNRKRFAAAPFALLAADAAARGPPPPPPPLPLSRPPVSGHHARAEARGGEVRRDIPGRVPQTTRRSHVHARDDGPSAPRRRRLTVRRRGRRRHRVVGRGARRGGVAARGDKKRSTDSRFIVRHRKRAREGHRLGRHVHRRGKFSDVRARRRRR
eukprot:29006-Pelagococcus_subviridis.AAC.11